MQVGEETLRKSIAAATDARARARLRVELASIVRARDPAAARDELTNAAREAGPTPALTLAAIAMARTLPPPERVAWLGGLARTGEGAVVPGIVVALAGAQLEADQPRDAARTLLALARDEHLPLHHRRAAANKLARICDRIDPILGRVALYTAAMLATGKGRRTLLRRALALPATIERDPARLAADDEVLARILLEWTKCDGEIQLAAEPLARLRAHKHASPAMSEVVAALAPRPARPPQPPRASPPPAPPLRSHLPPKAAFESRSNRWAWATRTGPGASRRRRSGCRGPVATSRRASRRWTRRCARADSSRRRCGCGERISSRWATRPSASRRCGCSPMRRPTRAWRSWRRAGVSTPGTCRYRRSRASPNPSRRPITIWPRSGCWRAATMIRRACSRCSRRRSRAIRAPTRRSRSPRS